MRESSPEYLVTYDTLKKKSYMDNIIRVASDVNMIKKDIKKIELASAISGFHSKDLVISGQDKSFFA